MPAPLLRMTGKTKSCNPPCFSKKTSSSTNLRKNIPNPHFLDQTAFTVVRKSKQLQNPLFLFLQKIIEQSLKNIRTSSPAHIFNTTPLHSGQEKQTVAKPPLFASKKNIEHTSNKNIKQSSNNLQKIILTGIHLQKNIQQIILPDINLPKIILPIFLPCSPAWNTI